MLRRLFCVRCLLVVLVVWLGIIPQNPVEAATFDPYVVRYLHVTEPISLEMDGQGATRPFSPQDLSVGKQLFENNCMNCHVGGATLPDPDVSLSLPKLMGANPPRTNVSSLVDYFRKPMIYDGSEETYWCREVPESWMSQEQVESLAAFILTAAKNAPGWGAEAF